MSHLQASVNELSDLFDRFMSDMAHKIKTLIQSMHSDDKTPLLNAVALRTLSANVGRQDQPTIVVFGDINRLKSFDDDISHEAGDAAISQAGKLLRTVVVDGCGGMAFRQSGDEFVLLLTEAQLQHFLTVVPMFAKIPFPINGQGLVAAMSFGFAQADAQADFAALLARAEMACQVAKFKGDGMCEKWTGELQTQGRTNRRLRCHGHACATSVTLDIPQGRSMPEQMTCPFCGGPLR